MLNNFFTSLVDYAKQLQNDWEHVLPTELQGLLRLVSMASGTMRLLYLLNWLKNRIIVWSQKQSLEPKETFPDQAPSQKRFDYTYIEGLLRELDDEVDELEKQNKSKAEILKCMLIRSFGIFHAVIKMAWDSLFTRHKPRS